ncbi:hypothetical protein C8J57DRAFT_1571477 [Mycena rebaudengoi]|nr:hypothetical protein C8J57DRAFT_1571477 [Mycena rebaudengoi]
MAAKRGRPPNLTLRPPAAAKIELEAPSPVVSDLDEDFDDDLVTLDSDSSPESSPIAALISTDDSDEDISKDFAELEQLRQNVQKNLRLRPIRSSGSLPKVRLGSTSPWDPDSEMTSPESSISSYFTPLENGPLSARFIGSDPTSTLAPPRQPQPIQPQVLYDRLCSNRRPLLIDTRPPAAHLAFHIRYSINVAIPSLILKRSRKPGGAAFQSLDALRQFVTTEQGKRDWDDLMRPAGPWDGDVIVYDDEMDLTLLPVIAPLLSYGTADYLAGGISSAGHHPDLETLILSGGEYDYGDDKGPTKSGGLFQLDTQTALRSKNMPQVDQQLSGSRSPLPLMSSVMSGNNRSQVGFRRPPPPRRPSAPNLRKLDTKSAERLNAPKLQVRTLPLKASSLSLKASSLSLAPPNLSIALGPPSPSRGLTISQSPTSATTPWSLSSPLSGGPDDFPTAYFTPPHTPGTPRGHGYGKSFRGGGDCSPPTSPVTARPDDPPTTEEPFPDFSISTILPGFLFLGPELTTPAHVAELQALGVRRILNIAAECDDDHGLHLRTVFERYVKIPMRDTVEEENIARGVREVCDILDDARLHSAATYVHCKAGKSRSVTAVMAYLIHANHWTLSRAYAFVLERRKGISPNIGFVSELMTFEEEELGGKSVGVQPSAEGGATDQQDHGHGHGHGHANYGVTAGNRRGGHVRESLPPVFSSSQSADAMLADFGSTVSAGLDVRGAMGDAGQEMEIKDASGRYRHARRAPVDETTLQPLRRVSKAGLESSAYS